jgi:hypothetical protein
MAGYDHYEEIVSSPCYTLSCHCRTNMVEILFHPHMTYRHTKVYYYTHTCYDLLSIEDKTITECILIYIHTYITCSPGAVKAVDLLLNPRHRAEGRGWIRSQWIDYILPSPWKHCHEMATTYYIFIHSYIHRQWDSMPELSFPAHGCLV